MEAEMVERIAGLVATKDEPIEFDHMTRLAEYRYEHKVVAVGVGLGFINVQSGLIYGPPATKSMFDRARRAQVVVNCQGIADAGEIEPLMLVSLNEIPDCGIVLFLCLSTEVLVEVNSRLPPAGRVH